MIERSPLDEWKLCMARKSNPSILLCGAKTWDGSVNLDHRKHCPNGKWRTTDIEAGDEVDLCFDLQTMSVDCQEKFDGIYCPSVLEHIERPWKAIESMSSMLNDEGALYLQTHQTFPIHFYPNDYFRFSQDALRVMCEDSGLIVVSANYENPCTITPDSRESVLVWNDIAQSFLNVAICAVKA